MNHGPNTIGTFAFACTKTYPLCLAHQSVAYNALMRIVRSIFLKLTKNVEKVLLMRVKFRWWLCIFSSCYTQQCENLNTKNLQTRWWHFNTASFLCYCFSIHPSTYENAHCWSICSHLHCFIHPSPAFNQLTLLQMARFQALSWLLGKCERRNHGLCLNPR